MRFLYPGVLLACYALVAANLLPTPVAAHHSFASEFDRDQPFEVSGAVTSVEWTNPHARLHIEVEDEGATTNYDFELVSPNVLIRQGWSRNDLQPGDKITVTGHRARNRPTVGRATGISRENGEAVFGQGVQEGEADE